MKQRTTIIERDFTYLLSHLQQEPNIKAMQLVLSVYKERADVCRDILKLREGA